MSSDTWEENIFVIRCYKFEHHGVKPHHYFKKMFVYHLNLVVLARTIRCLGIFHICNLEAGLAQLFTQGFESLLQSRMLLRCLLHILVSDLYSVKPCSVITTRWLATDSQRHDSYSHAVNGNSGKYQWQKTCELERRRD